MNDSMRHIATAVSRRLPAARRRALPELQPLSLVGSFSGMAVAAVCVAAVLAVTALEGLRPGLASLGALLFIPVLASAWLLGDREALVVSSLAVAARLIGYGVTGDLGTALAEVASLGALAIMTRLAAFGLAEGRERAAKMERDRRALELVQQRERIAHAVTDTAIRRLYALTVRLQAVSSMLEQTELRPSVDDAIAEADSLSTDFRALIFKPDD